MSRWALFWAFVTTGALLLVGGLLLPAHLRAVDTDVITSAGRQTPSIEDSARALAKRNETGPARLLLEVITQMGLPGRETLLPDIGEIEKANPKLILFGGPPPTLVALNSPAKGATNGFTDFLVNAENRAKVIGALAALKQPGLNELLNTRDLTNTAVFPPSSSSAGQAFDTALALTGLLVAEKRLTPGLSNAVVVLARQANHGISPQRYEQVLLDFMSLGQRLNWGQLASYLSAVDDAETLRLLAAFTRKYESRIPVLFAAVHLAGKPAAVCDYLINFSQTGITDLGRSLRYSSGGVRELVRRNQRMHEPRLSVSAAAPLVQMALYQPWPMLALKWLLYFAAGFLFSAAGHIYLHRASSAANSTAGNRSGAYRATGGYRGGATGSASASETTFLVAGRIPGPDFHVAREILFALGFLLVVLLFTEPFLSQENQRIEMPFRLRVPMIVTAAHFANSTANSSIMNQLSLLTLLLFFVLQALLYSASLVKLAEIRRQRVPSRIKLRLLENEDHLFDAGLYLGFVGTIISLIMVSLGVIKPSLMAAYSSTSFGIIFVSIFKIFHLRPTRRQLLLEAETAVEPAATRPVMQP